MSSLKNVKWKHYISYIAVAAFTLVFTILSFMGAIKSSDIYMLEKIAISIMLAVSLSVVVGFLGELSLGHAGFMCVGAYLGGKISAISDSFGTRPPCIRVPVESNVSDSTPNVNSATYSFSFSKK